MVNTTHHGVVLGRDRKLRTDIDFAKGFTTVLKIPWLVVTKGFFGQPVATGLKSWAVA